MIREGTLHIVWVNRRVDEVPEYRIGFADYATSGGAMSTLLVKSPVALQKFFSSVKVNASVQEAALRNLQSEGSTSILSIRLPDDELIRLGLGPQGIGRSEKDKVESVMRELSQKGHSVQAIVRGNGTMWFEVDRHLLVAWKEMVGLADRYYTFDELVSIYKSMIPVRLTVFDEHDGPVLAYAVAAPYTSATFSNRSGAKFGSKADLASVLSELELPAEEIIENRNPTKVYTLRGSQLLYLNLPVPKSSV